MSDGTEAGTHELAPDDATHAENTAGAAFLVNDILFIIGRWHDEGGLYRYIPPASP